MEAVFLFGLAVSIPIALLNRLMCSKVSSKIEEIGILQPSGKRRGALALFILISWAGLFFLIHRPMYLYEPEVSPCLVKVGTAVQPCLKFLVDETGKYPIDMGEFLKEVESQELTTRERFEDYLICPYNKTREISFEYCGIGNLKPGLSKFIILYEKPNNHFRHKKVGNYRTVLYSDGSSMARPETEIYDLLVDQSKNKDAFVWEPSHFEDSRPLNGKGWWEVELIKRTRPRAIAISSALVLLCAVAILL